MVNVNNAYSIVKKAYPLFEVETCLDFGTFFVFNLVPINIETKNDFFSGTMYDAVDKKTGRLYKYDLTSDLNAYHAAKSIRVKTFMDTPVSKLKQF